MDWETLYRLCNKNQWFTAGSCAQYNKLAEALRSKAPLDEIATIIWLCSDDVCRRDIKFALVEAIFKPERSTSTLI